MDQYPQDLVPLPTQPWDERPEDIPLDIEEVRTALWRHRGNISDAARVLKVKSGRLRNFVKKSPYLSREQEEAREMLADLAESVAYEALTDEDPARKDSMARFVLNSRIGRERGYGTGAGASVNIKGPSGSRLVISWEDGSEVSGNGDDAKVIDQEPVTNE